jgi:lipopolysaccharide biosynthesis glycosyltransferase
VKFKNELRLPWRVSQWIACQHLEALRWYYDRKVLTTRPYVTGEDCPHFEVHTLLGHKHVGMCLWSVKSFLHHANRRYTVVLHDDGSLTDGDIETLKKHLIRASIVRRQVADNLIREQLMNLPNCCEYRFTPKETSDYRGIKYNLRIFSLRLFDFNLISKASKILLLDADVLFFKEPRKIIEWAEDPEDRNSLYIVEQYLPIRNARNEIIDYERKIPAPTAANAGLLCLNKCAYKLETIENWVGANKELMDKYATFEQAAYNHLIKNDGRSMRLPDTYSFNYTDQDAIATHFGIKVLFFKNLERLQNVLH